MATTSSAKLNIAGLGHVYYAEADKKPFSLTSYQFKGGAAQSEGEWKWIGDHSSESMPEFSTDGGDTTTKRSWDRLSLRTTRSAENVTGTLHIVNLEAETFQLAFGASSGTGSVKIGANAQATNKAFFIVVEDEENVAGLYLPNVSLKGSFPNFSLEEFTEIPINLAINGSATQSAGSGGQLLWEWFPPVAK
ncbi:hypothetical protein [Corynebacterium minutissimum]|uniref:Major tail protein n=1 Tax=Corynebacterium minutissimum TaxID=38301 RepID=A0A376CW91_9CORY|nr:hypothetical protein [Corynebacterium minutissimum]QRP60674.1 hypothetical protein I6J26_11060 [Corynebacterium minutissimum]STC76768.1 Uncharacterised protein [Corynebacterium minutissimum]